MRNSFTAPLEELTNDDVARVGGKNASLGEMIRTLDQRAVRVPGGFATTAGAYRAFLAHNDLEDHIREQVDALHGDERELSDVGSSIRELFEESEFPEEVADGIREAYRELSGRYDTDEVDVAARKQCHRRGPSRGQLRRAAGELAEHRGEGCAAGRLSGSERPPGVRRVPG